MNGSVHFTMHRYAPIPFCKLDHAPLMNSYDHGCYNMAVIIRVPQRSGALTKKVALNVLIHQEDPAATIRT